MKQIICFLLLLLSGCALDDLGDIKHNDREVRLNFTIDTPAPQPMSRATVIDENEVNDLYILVFDENGRFIARRKAMLIGTSYTVTLPQSSNPRTIHFVANHDWSTFDDVLAAGKDEGEIIASMQTNTLAFWQRIELNGGINTTTFNPQVVPLIRNMSKFTLENLSTLGNVKFALYNMPSAGTVAPFNSITKTFDNIITESVGAVFTDNTAMTIDPIFSFERRNSTVTTEPLYVIIEGTFSGAVCYYKVDIIDSTPILYDITRNVWYKIIIQSVAKAGYTTIQEARNSPASNNISASVLMQSYPTVSDDSFVLSVDRTYVTFTSNNQTLNAITNYKTIGGVPQNSAIVITLEQDPLLPLVNGTVSYNTTTGALTAAIMDVPADGAARFATVRIRAGSLTRTINLRLHAPFTFENLSVTPSVVGNIANSPATLKFTIPDDAVYLLPFYCYIKCNYLTPELGNIEVVNEGGIYKYKWKVTAVGEQTINFKTNNANAGETILIDANLFRTGLAPYTNVGSLLRFSNVAVYPKEVSFVTGSPVEIRFTVSTVGEYLIYTKNLTPVTGSVVGGVYSYTATTVGEQSVKFTTNKRNSAETIRITGVNYVEHHVKVKNILIRISGTLKFNNAVITLPITTGNVTVTLGTEVKGVFTPNSLGYYNIAIDCGLGNSLLFTYATLPPVLTYTYTLSVTAPTMIVNATLM